MGGWKEGFRPGHPIEIVLLKLVIVDTCPTVLHFRLFSSRDITRVGIRSVGGNSDPREELVVLEEIVFLVLETVFEIIDFLPDRRVVLEKEHFFAIGALWTNEIVLFSQFGGFENLLVGELGDAFVFIYFTDLGWLCRAARGQDLVHDGDSHAVGFPIIQQLAATLKHDPSE